jgi:GAG-pre-integrase domain
MTFDSDSFPIAVDNCASHCMTNDEADFVGDTVTVEINVTGVGQTQAMKMATILWTIEDDNGTAHDELIPNSYLVPKLPVRLMSPQHWSQVNKARNAHSDTDADRITLECNDYVKTIPLNDSNIAIMQSAPGIRKARGIMRYYHSVLLPKEPVCFPAHLIPPDEEQDAQELLVEDVDDELFKVTMVSEGDDDEEDATTTAMDFDLDDVAIIEDKQLKSLDEIYSKDPSAALLHWHYRLGHLPFKTLQAMAHQQQLPRELATCKIPQCAACLYGKATKHPWRTRAAPSKVRPATINGPGDCVSIDQLESSIPHLIAQLRGFLTRKRYKTATVFVDHYSRLSYVHLQQTTSGEETLQAKRAFEAYAKSHGVTVKHYHADNGRFVEPAFQDHCKANQQTFSASGVNAHFQKGLAEKRIRDLQDAARTMLVHAKH